MDTNQHVKSARKKKRLPLIIAITSVILVFLLAGYIVGAYLTIRCRDELLNRLSGNPMNLSAVGYDKLAYEYRQAVSQGEYEQADTNEEILEIYRKFNEVHYEEKSLFYGWKCPDARNVIEADGKTYGVTVYIDLSARLFSTCVTNFCAEIHEFQKCGECGKYVEGLTADGKCVVCAGLTGYTFMEKGEIYGNLS